VAEVRIHFRRTTGQVERLNPAFPGEFQQHSHRFPTHLLGPLGQLVRSDGHAALREIGKIQHYAAWVTPPDKAGEWLPWVHVAIGNLKAFLLGTYHGVSSKYLQEYLIEFCYRFNRRTWEPEIPMRLRLLNACLTHTQIRLKMA
jgi:hypothetical protein